MFTHLNVHTHYSVLDALGKPSEYVTRAKKLGFRALAITDFNALYGAIEFYQECKKNDIKPIIGCDIGIADLGRFDKSPENKRYSVILLVKNQDGYQNLLKLVSKANLEGFYYVPRIDFELLERFKEGLICIASWRWGEISRKLLNDKEKEALLAVERYKKIFGEENFFLEIQNHPEDTLTAEINEKLLKFADQNKISLVATNNCLYVEKEDYSAYCAFTCIKKGQVVHDENINKLQGNYSLRSEEEMQKLFEFCPSALQMTEKITEKINFEIEFGRSLLPKFYAPDGKKVEDYLKELCLVGLDKKYPKGEQEKALIQLEYELKVINQMGFASYFLIVWDFVAFAKNKGIVVGPGRGSAAGSVISYCLDITTLDPLSYGLIFERFLNPERISMPDIDIDFSDYRRDEVLDYVVSKYGEDQVAQIITFGTMAAKAAIRDAGRVLGYSYGEVDKIAKMVPDPILGRYKPLKQYLEEALELKNAYEHDADAKKILDTAIKFEGSVRNVGTHACAVVISPDNLINHTPIQRAVGDKEGIVTQYSMKPIDKLGLLKMDFLGLSNLSIIEDTIKIIKRTHNKEIDINKIPLIDKKTFELFQKGETTGVFQFESSGMKRYLKDLKPTEIEDLIAMNSLYRPGPMQFIPDYIKGKHGIKEVKYLHESLKEILKPTYGIAVYQEQILQIAQKFAGFTLGEADLLRRAIGKKIAEELAAQREKFIDGAIKQGHSKSLATKMFDEVVEPFAGYGFNKAHAACYSMIAYQTAYLKTHFPAEFMSALLSADSSNTDRVAIEINECENMNIKVLPPSINESRAHFTAVDNKTIRFGLCAIKGLGENTAREMIRIREEEGKFENIANFAKRVPSNFLNKKTLEALIFSGAMDSLGEQNQLAASIDVISKFAKTEQDSLTNGQADIFGLMNPEEADRICGLKLNNALEATEFEKLRREKAYLGIYVSRHPLRGLGRYFQQKVKLIGNLVKIDLGKNIKLGGIVSNLRKIITRTNDLMLTFVIEDPSGRIEVVVFPKYYKSIGPIFKEDEVILMEGKLDIRGDKVQYSCNSAKAVSLQSMIQNAQERGIYNSDEKIDFRGTVNFEEAEIVSAVNEKFDEDLNNEENNHQVENLKNEELSDIYLIEISENLSIENMNKLKKVLKENHGSTRSVKLKLPNGQEMLLPIKIDLTSELEEQIGEILRVFEKNSV
ncbi:DNA polymerase III subunit alpha [Candidatus Peregrinibacteria bacterium RIFOXYB2_FULL_32_7]|nr:MAG: DNA polymerase III subunit alpha [Candidatus Peregrinibacteria bacterium RIFOXYB2_FULL_32_7]